MAYCTNGYRGMNGNGSMNGNGNGGTGSSCAVDSCGGISGGFSCVVNLIIILLVLEFLSQLLT